MSCDTDDTMDQLFGSQTHRSAYNSYRKKYMCFITNSARDSGNNKH